MCCVWGLGELRIQSTEWSVKIAPKIERGRKERPTVHVVEPEREVGQLLASVCVAARQVDTTNNQKRVGWGVG